VEFLPSIIIVGFLSYYAVQILQKLDELIGEQKKVYKLLGGKVEKEKVEIEKK